MTIPATENYRLGTPGCGTCSAFNATSKTCSLFDDTPVEAAYTCDSYSAPELKASKSFVGVEIARTGKFDASTGPVTFTTSDFENAEKAYKALEGHNAPIKLGHDEEQKLVQEDGFPNAGFVRNVRRDGDRLLADLVDVPDGVANLMEQGRLNARSIEALRNARIDGKKWPFVITGLALLGADLPAVDSLKDVVALYARKGIDLFNQDGEETIVIIARQEIEEVDVDQLIGSLHKLLERTEAVIYRRGGAPRFRTLVGTAVDELRAIAKKRPIIKKEAASMDPKVLAQILGLPETATEAEITTKVVETGAAMKQHNDTQKILSANQQQCADSGGTWDPATLTCKTGKEGEGKEGDTKESTASLKAELSTLRREVVVLKDDKASTDATKKVDEAILARKFAPASRSTLIKLAIGAPTEFEALVKATPKDAILASVGEAGHDGEGEIDSALEPSKADNEMMKATGITRDEFIEARAGELGKPVPQAVVTALVAKRSAKK